MRAFSPRHNQPDLSTGMCVVDQSTTVMKNEPHIHLGRIELLNHTVLYSSSRTNETFSGLSPRRTMFYSATSYELISNVVEIVAGEARLGSDAEDIVPGPSNEGTFPPCRDRTKRVPSMAGNQAKLRGLYPKFFLHVRVGVPRRLVVLHAIRAETPLK